MIRPNRPNRSKAATMIDLSRAFEVQQISATTTVAVLAVFYESLVA